jgi:hypothetical protein
MTVVDPKGGRLKLIGFGLGAKAAELTPGRGVEVVVELDLNEWNGRVEPQGRIVDARLKS